MGPPGASWDSFWLSWELLGLMLGLASPGPRLGLLVLILALLVPPGAHFGPPGACWGSFWVSWWSFWPSWRLLGLVLGLVGLIFALLRPSGVHFGPPGVHFEPPGVSWGSFRASWGSFWAPWGLLWAPPGALWAPPGAPWGPRGLQNHEKACKSTKSVGPTVFSIEKCVKFLGLAEKSASKMQPNRGKTRFPEREPRILRGFWCVFFMFFHALPSAKPRVLRGSSLGTRLKTTTQKRPPRAPPQARNLA